MNKSLLKINGLCTCFLTQSGIVRAVDDVSLLLNRGETLGVVGESGCGKSMTALSIMRLVPKPGKITGGEIVFSGENLLEKTDSEMQAIRGKKISMIFQEPMTSLDPVFTVGYQIQEVIMMHERLNKRIARKKTIKMLEMVGIPSPDKRVDDYPHQLSGGMRQRAMIAMALSCRPELLIADEPTTALDVTIQAQILELMMELKEDLQMAIMLITHDLGIVAEIADKTAIMYAGQIVESGDTKTIFRDHLHPYTLGLLGSIPLLHENRKRLQIIEGSVPNPTNMPAGCRFHSRCCHADEKCRERAPELLEVKPGHLVRCWLYHA